MAYDVHSGMTDDPHGDIHKRVAGDRPKVTAIAAANPKTATSFRDELYEMLAAAYMLRDVEHLRAVAELIMEFNGWKNGGGKAAYDLENV